MVVLAVVAVVAVVVGVGSQMPFWLVTKKSNRLRATNEKQQHERCLLFVVGCQMAR